MADLHRLPITWAVSDPAYSAATSRILRSDVDHELAILGDANWLGPTAGRTRFARELARRVSQARGAGIHVKTLVPRVASVERHIDLVVKQQITAISGVDTIPVPSRQTSLPRAIHYGVWELPTSGCMPVEAGRFTPVAWSHWRTWRRIRRAIVAAATYHLMIDATALAEAGPSAVRSHRPPHATCRRLARPRTCGCRDARRRRRSLICGAGPVPAAVNSSPCGVTELNSSASRRFVS